MKDKGVGISGMLGVGYEEPCPFCKGKNKWIHNKGSDLVTHLQKKHPQEFMIALFGEE